MYILTSLLEECPNDYQKVRPLPRRGVSVQGVQGSQGPGAAFTHACGFLSPGTWGHTAIWHGGQADARRVPSLAFGAVQPNCLGSSTAWVGLSGTLAARHSWSGAVPASPPPSPFGVSHRPEPKPCGCSCVTWQGLGKLAGVEGSGPGLAPLTRINCLKQQAKAGFPWNRAGS